MSSLRARAPCQLVKLTSLAVVPAAAALSVVLVLEASYVAYRDTSNVDLGWSSGSIALSDDDTGTAAFAASNLAPGSSGERCIAVRSTQASSAPIRLYGTDARLDPIASHIELTVVQGTGGSFGSCRGFVPLASDAAVWQGTLADFGASAAGYATGAGDWSPTDSDATRTFKITYSISRRAPDSTQGDSARIGFTWEARSA